MTLAVGPISKANVHFGESVDLERNGAYTQAPLNDDAGTDKFEKSGSAKKTVLWSLAGIVVVAAALAGLAKGKILHRLPEDEVANADFMKKTSHYLAVAGDWIADNTYGRIAKLFEGKKPEAEKLVDDAEGAAEKAGELLEEATENAAGAAS